MNDPVHLCEPNTVHRPFSPRPFSPHRPFSPQFFDPLKIWTFKVIFEQLRVIFRISSNGTSYPNFSSRIQIWQRKKFFEFFGFKPAVWHSRISKKKKEIIWGGVNEGKIKVIIGARSSLFLPFKKLGLIIVDEEHDQSYKQDEGIIYNARDMAIVRASFENIPINLITAVPSIETYENIKKGKYSLSKLNQRYKDAAYQIMK